MWGVANSLNDVLIPQFRKAFQLDDFASSLVQSAFYFGYFCFAIPASLFMRRFGYRAAVLMGLGLYGAGALLFLPAAQASQYYAFLIALYVIASGLAFLETSANPLIAVMGPADSADQRLNFAQTFNPIGTMLGSYVGGMLIFSDVHYTPDQLQALTPDAFAAFRASELGCRSNYPTSCIAAMVICLGCAGRLREISAGRPRPWRRRRNRRRLRRPREISALLARRARAVRVRGRAGGRVELPDPLHAAQFSGNPREGRVALVADLLRHFLRRAPHRHAADVARECRRNC